MARGTGNRQRPQLDTRATPVVTPQVESLVSPAGDPVAPVPEAVAPNSPTPAAEPPQATGEPAVTEDPKPPATAPKELAVDPDREKELLAYLQDREKGRQDAPPPPANGGAWNEQPQGFNAPFHGGQPGRAAPVYVPPIVEQPGLDAGISFRCTKGFREEYRAAQQILAAQNRVPIEVVNRFTTTSMMFMWDEIGQRIAFFKARDPRAYTDSRRWDLGPEVAAQDLLAQSGQGQPPGLADQV